MTTLYLDTHDKNIEIVLFKNEIIIDKIIETSPSNQSQVCIPTIIEILNKNNLKITDIEEIIVVNGPGSFTGVRIGVTIAKTTAWALNIPIRTITSLECILVMTENDIPKYVGIEEKNGYYIGKVKNNQIEEYLYVKKEELPNISYKDQINFSNSTSYEKIVKYAHKKDVTNPHLVNPLYVKKIEVEND